MKAISQSRLIVFSLVGLGLAMSSLGQSIFMGEERQVPRKYTQPEITKNVDGTVTYKPSVPTDFEAVYSGILLSPGLGAVSKNVKRSSTRIFEIRLKGGSVVKVRENDTFRVGGVTYRMLGFREDKLVIRNETTGAELQLGKGDKESDSKPSAKKHE